MDFPHARLLMKLPHGHDLLQLTVELLHLRRRRHRRRVVLHGRAGFGSGDFRLRRAGLFFLRGRSRRRSRRGGGFDRFHRGRCRELRTGSVSRVEPVNSRVGRRRVRTVHRVRRHLFRGERRRRGQQQLPVGGRAVMGRDRLVRHRVDHGGHGTAAVRVYEGDVGRRIDRDAADQAVGGIRRGSLSGSRAFRFDGLPDLLNHDRPVVSEATTVAPSAVTPRVGYLVDERTCQVPAGGPQGEPGEQLTLSGARLGTVSRYAPAVTAVAEVAGSASEQALSAEFRTVGSSKHALPGISEIALRGVVVG